MKKSIVLLPLLMLVLAACNPPTTSESNSEPINSDTSTEPVSSSDEGVPMSTIGQILAEATVGKMYKTRGTVVHLNGGQVFLQDDENKSINAYVGGDATAPLLVGNVIEVLGTYKVSNLAAQLEAALVEAVVSQVDDTPIVPLVIEDAATLATLTSADYSESGRLVRLNGVTTTSYDPDTKKFTLSLGASSVVGYAGFSAAHELLGENRPAIQALINNISLAGVEFDIMGALFSATGAGVWNLGLPTVNYIVAPELPDRFLASIAVTTEPTDKDYTAGQNFDPAGMVVTATYDDATTAVVTPLCTYSPSPLTQGLTEVTVSYKEGTITKTTTVTGIVVVAPQAAQDNAFNSFDFIDGGSSSNSGYANTNISTDVKYAADNPGGVEGTTSWMADWCNLNLTFGTRLGGKLASAVQTDDVTPWANIRTNFVFPHIVKSVQIDGSVYFGTNNITAIYVQSSTDGATWTTVGTLTEVSGLAKSATGELGALINFEGLSIAANSYIRVGVSLTAMPDTNSGFQFTKIAVYRDWPLSA